MTQRSNRPAPNQRRFERDTFGDVRDNPVVRLDTAMRAEGLPLLLTMHEAEAVVRVHYQTIWKLVQCHQLKAHKQGGNWRIIRSDLARWTLNGGRT
ncbi:MAG: helix-turn-helix domain-containing protein [Planctomycetes bacterium]|nr:helix-turn-helix domain-containing protein [Planctomycetota bacterium]